MACVGEKMGFYRPEWGDTGGVGSIKRKFRWLFNIPNITSGTVDFEPLPCLRASRPKFQFKEMQAEHLNETISYPSKPEWQPIQISLCDRNITTQNPIFTWLKQQYDPTLVGCGKWFPCVSPLSFKTCVTLQLLDGCGCRVEEWTLEHCYPQNIDWGELDMASMDMVTVDFSLRYDRAFQTYPVTDHFLYDTTSCAQCFEPSCGEGGTSGGDFDNGSDSESENSENFPAFDQLPDRTDGNFPNPPFNPITNRFEFASLSTPDFIML